MKDCRLFVSFACLATMVCILTVFVACKLVGPDVTVQHQEQNMVIVQTGLQLVKDFYGQEKLMLSYSVNGEPYTMLLDQPFEESLPRYQAYLRSLGDFSILGE